MSNEIKPLKHYINNREKLLQQAFLSIQDTQLQKIIPASLTHLPIEELKAECLVQLLGMSKKRILCVLEGRTLESSSSSESDDSDVLEQKGTSEKTLKDKSQANHGGGEPLNQNNSDNSSKINMNKTKEEKVNDEKRKKAKKSDKKGKLNKRNETSKSEEDETLTDDNQEKEKDCKTLLEILELEMRAKAIRALLRQVDGEEQASESTKKTEPETTTTNVLPTAITLAQDGVDLTLDTDEDHHNREGPNKVDKRGRDAEERVSTGNTSESEEMEWVTRWLKSKDVKRVVATSKMITTVRKKMKTIHKTKSVENRVKNSSVNIEGSVNEYKMLSSDKQLK